MHTFRKVSAGALLGLALLCEAALGWLHLQSPDYLISLFRIQASRWLTPHGVLHERLMQWGWDLRLAALFFVLVTAFLIGRPIRKFVILLFVVMAAWAGFVAFLDQASPHMLGLN